MIGACLLWVGWFGFNAGSNLEANGVTALALHQHLRRHRRRGAGLVSARRCPQGKPSMLGAASGAVAGLVAITPACGFVGPMGAIVLGVGRRLGLLLGASSG